MIILLHVCKFLLNKNHSFIFAGTLDEMNLPHTCLQWAGIPLASIWGQENNALGRIDLPVMFGEGDCTEHIHFNVVNIMYQYNIILGRVYLNKLNSTSVDFKFSAFWMGNSNNYSNYMRFVQLCAKTGVSSLL